MLNKLYHDLLAFYPMKPWWPGDSALETAVGTILTQNTSWKGVLKSIENLKKAGKLDLDALLETPDGELAELIRPSGYANLKTRRLKNLLRFVKTRYGTVDAMRAAPKAGFGRNCFRSTAWDGKRPTRSCFTLWKSPHSSWTPTRGGCSPVTAFCRRKRPTTRSRRRLSARFPGMCRFTRITTP
ncbi:MAG: hypothetical protein K6C40_13430 [Thermoguttaceae bacterium]|nr:hypothetical protein [Thermoguttaceae bacterium]